MSSLLNNNILPLWAWILIIAIASLVVIVSTAFVVRYIQVHKREADFIETFGSDNLPQRQITVRRGRVIAKSRVLSLTGSKFGLSAFGLDEEDARSGARSKSPFEWWAATRERRFRNSQMTQARSSVYSDLSNPLASQVYQKPQFQSSSGSLASDDGKCSPVIVEVDQRSSSPLRCPKPARPRPINFSHSFQNSRRSEMPFRLRSQTLSRISEGSHHSSMISNPSGQSRVQSYASTMTFPEVPGRDQRKSAAESIVPELPNYESMYVSPRQPPTAPASTSTSKKTKRPDLVKQYLTVAAATTSHSSPTSCSPRSFDSYSAFSYNDSQSSLSQQRQRRSPHPVASPEPASPALSRTDNHPTRKSSRKGRTLQKKTLRHSQLVTMVNS